MRAPNQAQHKTGHFTSYLRRTIHELATDLAIQIADVRFARQSVRMDHETLAKFLSGTLTSEALVDEIDAEVASCNESVRAGEPGYIAISNGLRFEVNRQSARRLLEALANGRLPIETASYVAHCIIMSDDFEFTDDAVRDAIFFAADDASPPSRDETLRALTALD